MLLKKLFSLFFLMALSHVAFGSAQEKVDTTYYNLKWKVCSRQEASYFRTSILQADGLFNVTDRYLDGSPQMTGTMKSMNPDVSEGKFAYYDSTGKITSIQNYRNGISEGEYTTYYPKSQHIKLKGLHHNGKLLGLALIYDSLSDVIRTRQYHNAKGFIDSLLRFTPSGKLYSRMIRGSVNHRIFTTFDTLGNITSISNFDSTYKREGLSMYFYPGTNAIQDKTTFKAGLRDGPYSKLDYACQKPLISGQYNADKACGIWKTYAPCSNALISTCTKVNGKMEGKYLRYDPKTRMVVLEGTNKGGKEVGEWKYYFRGTTKVRIIRNYVDGNYDGKLTSYYPNGKVRRIEEYANGIRIKSACYGVNGSDTAYYKQFVEAVLPENYQSIIQKQLTYPKKAFDAKLDGKVVVELTVSEEGTVTHSYIHKSTNEVFNREAVRLAELVPILSPGLEDGLPIHSSIKIPITFTYSEFAPQEPAVD